MQQRGDRAGRAEDESEIFRQQRGRHENAETSGVAEPALLERTIEEIQRPWPEREEIELALYFSAKNV